MDSRAIGSLLTAALLLGACSNKAIYDNVQANVRLECNKKPHSEYEECVRRAEVPYEEYERARKEALEE